MIVVTFLTLVIVSKQIFKRRIFSKNIVQAVVWTCSLKNLFLKFRKIYKKTHALESIFNIVVGLNFIETLA